MVSPDVPFAKSPMFKVASSSATLDSFILRRVFASSNLLSKYVTFCVRFNTWDSKELKFLGYSNWLDGIDS
uniref:Uncharacterized protein MANES_05G204700 n=1 Tax=Rhizophora mucronata TaxID=61149 RepID=A0A2P2J658_RHIMU